jgi:hypothetical protein
VLTLVLENVVDVFYDDDVTPDGKRIAVLKTPIGSSDLPASKFSFVFNFFDELQQKVPSGQ